MFLSCEAVVTISVYQVDNLIKAYNKQTRPNMSPFVSQGSKIKGQYVEMLSQTTDFDKKDSYQKISDSLLNVILKDKL